MSASIVSVMAAHKLAAALIIGSLAISGGTVAAASNLNHQQNTVGDMSFTINPEFNVTTIASLNLGTLSSGSTGSISSTAVVDFTSAGNYTIGLANTGLLHKVFSSFNVTVSGLGNGRVNLNLSQTSDTIYITSSGNRNVQVTVAYIVSSINSFEHGIAVSNEPFLQLFSGTMTPGLFQHGQHYGQPHHYNNNN